jgi:FAD/FMN-containing dehydrogenase
MKLGSDPKSGRPVASTAEAVAAVQDALNEGRRVVATSGGQCLEGFVSDPDVRAIVDVAPMKRIEFDTQCDAVMVEAGATIGDVYRTLAERWGVLTPLGNIRRSAPVATSLAVDSDSCVAFMVSRSTFSTMRQACRGMRSTTATTIRGYRR